MCDIFTFLYVKWNKNTRLKMAQAISPTSGINIEYPHEKNGTNNKS